jgi:hypothetical protein
MVMFFMSCIQSVNFRGAGPVSPKPDRMALAASLGGQIKDDAEVGATAPERTPRALKKGRRHNPPPLVAQS